ncbi:MAG: class I SAM-dependent methyltransferase [Gammaproteobacteria bacterium]|nr:class I SAM-dependent methyltransferase [Gammaproteobacteria bacterium]
MKRCLACNEHYAMPMVACPSCKFKPILMNGFHAYAPDSAHAGGGFKSSYFSELARLEEANFWFQARNRLILWGLEKYCKNFKSFLEIGCGTGYVLSGISKQFPHSTISGSEIFIDGLAFAAARLPSVNFMQMDARNIPFEEEFDVIGAFDVLEHIEEDERTLAQVHTALRPEGYMLLTVPQHAWLWSPVDEYACHVRRYSALDIHAKITAAGFHIIRSTSFVTSLLPAMLVSRIVQKRASKEKFDATSELKISHWLNSLFFRMLSLELALIKKGFNFPIGGSRLVVAKKI